MAASVQMPSDRPETTKKTLAALEKVFAAEINGRLPLQSRAKVYRELCDEGLVETMERRLGGRFPIVIAGYQLTHAGRMLYCESCDNENQTAHVS